MDKYYVKMVITPVEMRLEGQILEGSVTTCQIEPGTVEVESFQSGFEEDGNPFKSLSFD